MRSKKTRLPDQPTPLVRDADYTDGHVLGFSMSDMGEYVLLRICEVRMNVTALISFLSKTMKAQSVVEDTLSELD